MDITEILVPAQETVWLHWAVQYFFYIGAGFAAAILFFIAVCAPNMTSHRLRSALALVLAICGAVGPLALTAELHQPGRAWHFFVYLTPSSWMSRGSLLLPLFSLCAIGAAWLYLREDLKAAKAQANPAIRLVSYLSLGQWQTSQTLMRIVAAITVVSGLSIAVYTGSEVYTVASRPLWHQLISPVLWFISAFPVAAGMTAVMLCLMPEINAHAQDYGLLKKTTLLTAFVSLLLLPLWIVNGDGLTLLHYTQWQWRFALLCLLFLLLIVSAWRLISRPRALLIFAGCGLAAGWYIRWVTLLNVQSIPRNDAGLFPQTLSLGSDGLLGILAMAGLWLALAAITSSVSEFTTDSNRPINQAMLEESHHE